MPISSTQVLHTNLYGDIISNATPENDVAGGGTTVFALQVDNRQNTSVVYTKIYDALSASVGSDNPGFVFKIPAGKRRFIPFGSDESGVALSTGLSLATVTTPGTAGTTSPTNPVKVKIATN